MAYSSAYAYVDPGICPFKMQISGGDRNYIVMEGFGQRVSSNGGVRTEP